MLFLLFWNMASIYTTGDVQRWIRYWNCEGFCTIFALKIVYISIYRPCHIYLKFIECEVKIFSVQNFYSKFEPLKWLLVHIKLKICRLLEPLHNIKDWHWSAERAFLSQVHWLLPLWSGFPDLTHHCSFPWNKLLCLKVWSGNIPSCPKPYNNLKICM